MKAKNDNWKRDLPGTHTRDTSKRQAKITQEDGSEVLTDIEEQVEVKKAKNGSMIYDVSPFMHGYKVDTRQKRRTVDKGTAFLKPADEKYVEAVTTVSQLFDVDKATFTKLFKTPDFKLLFNLKPSALHVLLVIIDIVGMPANMNTNVIRLTWAIAESKLKGTDAEMSYSTYNRSIKDLIEEGYIATARVNGEHDGWFFINQDRLFNGDRVRFVKEYRLANENKTYEPEIIRTPLNRQPRLGASDEEFDGDTPPDEA